MKSKKVLVTGSSGFIGSHVADALDEQGYQVTLFDTVSSKYKTKSQKEYIGDINAVNEGGETPFIIAAREGRIKIIKL